MFLVFLSQHTKLITECLDNHTEWVNNSRQTYIHMMYLVSLYSFLWTNTGFLFFLSQRVKIGHELWPRRTGRAWEAQADTALWTGRGQRAAEPCADGQCGCAGPNLCGLHLSPDLLSHCQHRAGQAVCAATWGPSRRPAHRRPSPRRLFCLGLGLGT